MDCSRRTIVLKPTRFKEIRCNICFEIFTFKSSLNAHKNCVHYPNNIKKFKCSDCIEFYKFKKNNTKRLHNTQINYKSNFVCKGCFKNFSSKNSLKLHDKYVHLDIRPFECRVCEKFYKRKENLNYHMEVVHNIKLNNKIKIKKTFTCTTCLKNFTTNYSLKLHKSRIHDKNNKRYTCEYCLKEFDTNFNYVVHVNCVHYNKKKYKCDVCGMRYKQSRSLKNHIIQRHIIF